MQSARWNWLTLIACAAAAVAGGAGAQQAPAAAPAGEAEPQARSWRLPPILWTGSLAYDLRTTSGSGEGRSLAQLVTGTIGAKTYIYAPWFAVVGGSLGLTTSWTRDRSSGLASGPFETDASLHETIRGREQFLTGNARVDVFPQSRFPFEFHVDRNDSRIDSGLASTFGFQTSAFGFSQRYRPLNGAWNVSGGYDHREQSAEGIKSRQDALTGDFSTRWKHNELNVGASHSRARSDSLDDESRFGSLVARHNYAPSANLSVNSTANWTRTQEFAGAGESDLQVMQWSSVGLWRRENSPLTLTGSARALHLREQVGGSGVDTGGVSLGANYEFSPRLRLMANAGANLTRSGDATTGSFTGSVGAAYQGESRQFAGARYDWFTSGTAGTSVNQGSELGDERQTMLNLQLGHSISRNWQLSESSSVTVNGSQSLNWSDTRSNLPDFDGFDAGANTSLLNSVSATWQTGGSNRSAYARASYSDSMELQGGDDRFRLFNFQISGNYALDNQRSINGDITFQRTWQQTGGLDGLSGTTGTVGASGEISYQHQRLFGVPRLRFVSRLKLAQDVLKQPGTLLSLPDRETRLWENRLDWSIGRLDTHLLVRFSQVDGRNRQSIMFRVQRTFGD